MSPTIEIQLIAILISISCALSGAFLVLRKMSMLADSITHTILLGIVLAFLATQNLSSPFLLIGAMMMGLFTVWLIPTISQTRLVSEDAAIGLVFPLLFSVAIILISRYASSIHLDVDAVLMGELAFAPFDRLILGGVDIGARAVYTAAVLLCINIAVISTFFKELTALSFDPVLICILGFSPSVIHYTLMGLVSITAVSAFEAAGSILVVAFMVGPPVSAYLLTHNLRHLLFISAGIGALNSLAGFWLAMFFDVSISGCIALMTGIVFLFICFFAPKRGVIFALHMRLQQRHAFLGHTLLLHLYTQGQSNGRQTNFRSFQLQEDLKWRTKTLQHAAHYLLKQGHIGINGDALFLTGPGSVSAETLMHDLFL